MKVDENGYIYLGILELDEIKGHEMKIKVTAEYKRRLKLILKSKLNRKNKIQAINTWAVALLRYGAGIINRIVDELEKMDRTTRKTLTMYGNLHPKIEAERLYLKRKHGKRGLIYIDMRVRSEENNLGFYVRESNEILLKGVKKVGMVKTENLMEKKNSRKIAKINGTKREYMDSLFLKCLKKKIKTSLANGWCKVISKCKLKQRYVLHKNKH